METKSIEVVTSTPEAKFVYVDLSDAAGWERLEKMLAQAELAAVDMFAEQVDSQPAKWRRQ